MDNLLINQRLTKASRNLLKIGALLVLLVITFYRLSIVSAHAAEIGFATNKSLFDAEILPGTTYQDELVISNTSHDIPLPLHLRLSVWNLADGSEEDIEFLSTAEDAVNPLRWFLLVTSGGKTPGEQATVEPLLTGHDMLVGPGEEEVLRFRVRPPNDVAAGTYLVSMRFQSSLPEQYYETKGGPRFAPELVVLFFLKIPYFSLDGAQTDYAAEIVEMGLKSEQQGVPGVIQVAKADVLDDAAKIIAAKVRNTGTFYFKTDGVLQLTSWTGRVVKEIPLPPKYMLPGKVRTIEIPLSAEKDSGFFARIGKYIVDNSYFGKYTATLLLNYPGRLEEAGGLVAGAFTESSISFWVFPWRFILSVAAIAGLLTIFFKQFGRRMLSAVGVLFFWRKRA